MSRAHLVAPGRLSQREHRYLARLEVRARRLFTPAEERARISERRLYDAPLICTASTAAWALCVERQRIYRAIRDGDLPAEKESLPEPRGFRWLILRSDVEHLAAALYGELETVRLLEVEGGER